MSVSLWSITVKSLKSQHTSLCIQQQSNFLSMAHALSRRQLQTSICQIRPLGVLSHTPRESVSGFLSLGACLRQPQVFSCDSETDESSRATRTSRRCCSPRGARASRTGRPPWPSAPWRRRWCPCSDWPAWPPAASPRKGPTRRLRSTTVASLRKSDSASSRRATECIG